MKKQEFEVMYKLENKHWWFVGKRNLIFNFMDKLYKNKNNLNILDIGCGTGIIMQKLSKYGKVYGIDVSDDALKFCKARNLKNIKKASVMKIPFKNNSFDLVGCFDVLYHKGINDDLKAIKEIYRVLKKSGRLLVTDSAMICLWSKHDIATHARQRYNKKELKEKLEKAGFIIEKMSYYNFFLFPLVFIMRKLDNIFNKNKPAKSNIQETNPLFNKILISIFKIESKLLNFINFPFGVSIFCIAKKDF